MSLRIPAFLAAATAALAIASGCDLAPEAASRSNDPAPVVHSQVRVGVKSKPGGKRGARPKKRPMQTGPAQSSTLSDL